jgi:hypothetical protein
LIYPQLSPLFLSPHTIVTGNLNLTQNSSSGGIYYIQTFESIIITYRASGYPVYTCCQVLSNYFLIFSISGCFSMHGPNAAQI